MAVLSAMSDLEAVNRMLASIGQAPVNSIPATGIGDASKAYQQLTETARDVQEVGYCWNSDGNYKLTPDASGYIPVPNGALDIDASAKATNTVVRRNPDTGVMSLYDLDNQTFDFSANYDADTPLEVDIIWGYPFNDLPAPARYYIATAAARRFQAQLISSPILDRFNELDEERAFMLLKRYERRCRDTNMFRRSPSLQRWTRARRF